MAILENAIDQLSRAEEVPKTRPGRRKMRSLRRVAILGAGTMGARIAAHFANAGVPSLLMSRAKPEPNRNATALKAIADMGKQRPNAFFADDTFRLVKAGNFEDNLKDIADCDWVIETVAENLQIKRELWAKVAAFAKPDTILSTCTSGIPLSKIVEGFTPEFRRNFLGTHFFNPTRYMHLLEVIPGPETDPDVLDFVADYGDQRLGKGVVLCKDTPNFVANRIGCFFGATVAKVTLEDDYTIEEADALTGPVIGLPNSASFRMLDLVGLDIWAGDRPQSVRSHPARPAARALPAAGLRKGDDRARLARREDRAGLLQARRQGRGEGDLGHRLEDAGIPPDAEAALPVGGRRSGHRRPRGARERDPQLRRPRR